jgi:lysophospholipase L1-like esterase
VEHTPLRLAVLGDSLAYGIGADRLDDTVAARLSASLHQHGHAVELHVLAVPGATSTDLAPQVDRAASLRADLVLIVVGANDLARQLPPARTLAALHEAVGALRAGGTTVVVSPAPDLSTVPDVPPALRPALRAACSDFQRQQAASAEAAGAVVAPVAAELASAFAADRSLFSADRFHPSSAGYARIAAALAPHVIRAADDVRRRYTAA